MADTYDLLLTGGTVLNPATKTNEKLERLLAPFPGPKICPEPSV